VEETIGYEAPFSPEEWASMNFVEWGPEPEPDPGTASPSDDDALTNID